MIEFDINNNIKQPTLVLCDRVPIQRHAINFPEDIVTDFKFNSANSISFDIHKEHDNIENPCWDLVKDLMVVCLKEENEYYEIAVSVTENDKSVKSVIGTSLCEAELSQIYLFDVEINTPSDIKRDDYKRTVLYNELDHEASLLHRILKDKAPHYTIGHVDPSIANLQRSFSISSQTIYDFLTKTLSEEVGCIVLFNSSTRTINFYDLENRCVDCNERIESETICPDCGGTNIIEGYGEDTAVFISCENLGVETTLEGDKDSVKNCFKIKGGDDLINSTIRAINPNGDDYIYHFSSEQKEKMPSELVDKIESYDILYKESAVNLKSETEQLYDKYDKKLELESTMMPTSERPETTAVLELAKLTTKNLSPTAVSKLSSASLNTTTNAVLNYAKVYIDSNYKIEISNNSYAGTTWKGKFKLTSYSDPEDTAESVSPLSITINEDFETFTKQKVSKVLTNEDSLNIDMDILDSNNNIDTAKLNSFKTLLTKYCLSRLNSFQSAYQSVLDSLTELGISSPTREFYKEIYVPYKTKLDVISSEMLIREGQIKVIDDEISAIQANIKAIQEGTNLRKYLGDTFWKQLRSYIREDTYDNNNYISDGLTNAELISKAVELIKVANKELLKGSIVQHSVSTNMKNLLALQEFKPLWTKFKTGNWIHEKIDGVNYKLRLLSYTINYSDIESCNVDFSDTLAVGNSASDISDVLSQSQSMASNYSSVAKQAKNSYDNSKYIEGWLQNGLDTTAVRIVNSADNQNITYDKHGLLARQWDDIENGYSPEQTKLYSYGFALTHDNWNTVVEAVGKIYYNDPLTGEKKVGYGINSELLIGRLLLGEKLVISNANNTSVIDEKGLTIENGISQFKIDTTDIKGLLKISKKIEDEWKPQMQIDVNGYLRFSDGTIIGEGAVINGAEIGEGTNIDWAKINKIDANYIISDTLDTSVANIIQLNADSAIIRSLDTQYLNTDFANIEIGNFNDLFVKEGTMVHLTASNVTIDDAVIKDLIAKNITVSDLAAGIISTKNFIIQSDDGTVGLHIIGNTLQMYDSEGNIGIQLGYTQSLTDHTVTSRPSLIITDEEGAVMLDSKGLHDAIVPDKFIKTDMVADKAIGDAQIDWSTTKDVVDTDGNSLWITASQILNSNEFTTKFNTIETDISNNSTSISGLESSMNAADLELSNSIKKATFLHDSEGNILQDKDGNNITLENKLVEQVQNLDGISNKVTNAFQKTEQVPILDENGDPVLDEEGNPTYRIEVSEIENVQSEMKLHADLYKLELGNTFVDNDSFEEYRKFSEKATSEALELRFQQTSSRIDEVSGEVSKNQETLEQYIRFTISGMELGKIGNPFTTELDNESLKFKQSGRTIAYISNNKLYITDAEVNYSLRVGNFIWLPRSNGNLSLKWK